MKFDFDSLSFIETDKDPHKLAFAGSDRNISWLQFYQKTNELCNVLQSLQIPKGHPVIIYGHKEHSFPVAMAACIKCSIPYIPVDKIMPADRIKKIKENSLSQVIIYTGENKLELNFAIEINPDHSVHKKSEPVFDLKDLWNAADPLCYIMFTSGSTGEPKGVMITINAIKSFLGWLSRDFMFKAETVFMNQAIFSFDLSVFELYGTFHFGSSLIMNDVSLFKSPAKLIERLIKYNCTLWDTTPSFVTMYLSEPKFNEKELQHLETFLFIGEELPVRTVIKLRELFPSAGIYNSYGPTEATVATTLIEITDEIAEKYSKSLPIGYPKDDGEILIFNENNDPLEHGEIVIAGDHVSIGYLNNEALTADRFILHNNKRAYKTGDYGYYKDGMLFFDGRKDEQVKLHGYRIEIGDITSQLHKNKMVKEAITIPLRSGTLVKKIISFAVINEPKNDHGHIKQMIIDQLKQNLPEYMVPSDLIFVNEFPTNANHKIDRNKLIDLYMNM